MSSFIDAYFQADLFGKMIFLSLFVLSLVSWAILIQKIVLTRRVKVVSDRIAATFQQGVQTPLNIELRRGAPEESPSPFFALYHVLRKQTMEILNKNHHCQQAAGRSSSGASGLGAGDIDLVAARLDTTMAMEMEQIQRGLFILPTVVSLAPFLGLLGTVWGILITFGELRARSGGAINEAMLGGLSTALVTTVLGLVIAIPALIAYNYLRSQIRQYRVEMENFSQTMLAAIEIHYRRVD